MTKRRKLVGESILLTLGFLSTQFIDINYRYGAIFVLGLITYFFTAFILKEDLKKIAWVVALPVPLCFVVSSSLFYFLLPSGLITRALILGLFAIGLYAILLAENIFCVASGFQTIPLLRAAQAIGFLINLVIAFFSYNTIFSFKQISWINAFFVFIVSFPLIIASLWSISLELQLSKKLVIYSLTLSVLLAEVAFFISFWPLTITIASLALVSFLYMVLGISQSYFSGRLFHNTLQEFLYVGIIILVITFFLAQW